MGLIIDRSEFSEEDYRLAGARLQENLRALQMLFARPEFGRGDSSLGAELEMCIVDEQAQALPLNRQVLADSLDPNLQPELDRFNLEYNLSPVMSAGTPFATMRAELENALAELGRIAATHGGRIVPIGILPTLSEAQVQSNSMTDLDRYRALQAGIQRLRQLDFHIRIDGAEPLDVKCDSVTLEGANTSFQVHLRVNPDEFASYYNAAQLATPLALALSANSPFFLGHSLWDETRIALFKQSVDTRGSHSRQWRRAARVPFGHGWVRHGALELFAESCHLYPIILPVCGTEDAVGIAESGGMPELLELRLHQGTIWNWNRAVFDASAGGHVRIEFRALPSGPAPIDMMANAAFLVGLTVGLSKSVDAMLSAFPFRYAEYNFYRAAQHSLRAELLWPTLDGNSPRAVNAATLCAELLETAERGLEIIGVDAAERKQLIGIIRERLKSGVTPALWQRRLLERMPGAHREEALVRVVEEYMEQVNRGRPVSEWP
ncbi:MAG: glutamate-cysteine ligase family protein [Woeseia sp.]